MVKIKEIFFRMIHTIRNYWYNRKFFRVIFHPKIVWNYILANYEYRKRKVQLKSRPFAVHIENTNICNLKCIQCLHSNSNFKGELGMMNIKEMKNAVDMFPYAIAIALNGFGEPLLHKDLAEIIEYIYRKRPYVNTIIYTNGMLLNEDISRRLIRSRLTHINISMDAASKEIYERIRRGSKFDVVTRNIRNLVQMKRRLKSNLPIVSIDYTFMEENIGRDPDDPIRFIKLAKRLGVDSINGFRMLQELWGHKKKWVNSPEIIDRIVKSIKDEGMEIKFHRLPRLTLEEDNYCDYFWRKVQINFSGENIMCCWHPLKEEYSHGNIFKEGFENIWNNESYLGLRQKVRDNNEISLCKICNLKL